MNKVTQERINITIEVTNEVVYSVLVLIGLIVIATTIVSITMMSYGVTL